MPTWLVGLIEQQFDEGDSRATIGILLVAVYAGFGIALSLAYWSVDNRKTSEASLAKLTVLASKVSFIYIGSFIALAAHAFWGF